MSSGSSKLGNPQIDKENPAHIQENEKNQNENKLECFGESAGCMDRRLPCSGDAAASKGVVRLADSKIQFFLDGG